MPRFFFRPNFPNRKLKNLNAQNVMQFQVASTYPEAGMYLTP